MSDEAPAQLVVFSLGAEEYALPIERVHEIIRHHAPRSVASRTPWISGVISLRGKIVPVLDLAERLGLPATVPAVARRIVIVDTGGDQAGMIVDDVREVVTLERDLIDPAPPDGDEAVAAVVRIDERLVILLDADGLFPQHAAPGAAAA